jgi:hypothetical protein
LGGKRTCFGASDRWIFSSLFEFIIFRAWWISREVEMNGSAEASFREVAEGFERLDELLERMLVANELNRADADVAKRLSRAKELASRATALLRGHQEPQTDLRRVG